MKSNKRPFFRKSDFAGTSKVFQFTVTQMFKNKSNRVSLLIMFLFSVLSVPIMTFFSGGETLPEQCPIATIYYYNETQYPIDFDSIVERDVYFQDVTIKETIFSLEERENWSSLLEVDEAIIHVFFDEEVGEYCFAIVLSNMLEDTSVFWTLADETSDLLEEAKFVAMGATQEQLNIALSDYNTYVCTLDEFWAKQEQQENVDWETQFAVQYGYSILVLVLFMMSSSFIIQAIVEEKSSKLVELLMVSVQPLAMIVGKIFAVMIYVFGMLFIMVTGFGISYGVTEKFTNVSISFDGLTQIGIGSILSKLNIDVIIIILVSLVLGYFTFSILAGIAGACCSTTDDIQSANMSVVLIALACYLVGCTSVAFESNVVVILTSIIPILSIFCAPVQYIMGSVNIVLLCISWILQGIVLLALAAFGAKVYRDLMMYKGTRIKFKELLRMVFNKSDKEVA